MMGIMMHIWRRRSRNINVDEMRRSSPATKRRSHTTSAGIALIYQLYLNDGNGHCEVKVGETQLPVGCWRQRQSRVGNDGKWEGKISAACHRPYLSRLRDASVSWMRLNGASCSCG